jgi:hypothetical protein
LSTDHYYNPSQPKNLFLYASTSIAATRLSEILSCLIHSFILFANKRISSVRHFERLWTPRRARLFAYTKFGCCLSGLGFWGPVVRYSRLASDPEAAARLIRSRQIGRHSALDSSLHSSLPLAFSANPSNALAVLGPFSPSSQTASEIETPAPGKPARSPSCGAETGPSG